MILEKEYLEGFRYEYLLLLDERIIKIHNSTFFQQLGSVDKYWECGFDYIYLDKYRVDIITIGGDKSSLDSAYVDDIKKLINELKVYYLYNKRKLVIESL